MNQFGKIIIVSLLSCLFFLPHAYADPLEEDEYRIISAKSGLCLDVKGDSQDDGTPLIQWDCHGGKNQIFYIYYHSDGDGGFQYALLPYYGGMAIDVPAFSTEEGTGIVQWRYNSGNNNQLWNITPFGDGTYEISNVHSNLCMDVKYPSSDAGETIIQYGCHGGDNQRWILEKVSE